MSHLRQPRIRVAAILPREDTLLLVRHRKGEKAYWMLPGGGLDYGETFEQCAIREIQEETGLEISVDRLLYLSEAICPRGTRHVVNAYVLGKIEGGGIRLPIGDVIDSVEFVPVRQLSELTLYPPIATQLQNAHAEQYQGGILHLGSMWVD